MHLNFKKLGDLLVVALIITNCVELGLFFKFRNDARIYRPGVRFPRPSGYLMDKSYFTEDLAPCFLIRVSSDECPYCRLDQDPYALFVQQARQKGCRPLILTPVAGKKLVVNSEEALQLQYVDMRLGRALNAFMTPQTILLDAEGRLVWAWEGTMDDRALARALKALGKIH